MIEHPDAAPAATARPPRARGYTLVEVMLAVVLGGIVLAGLSGVTSTALSSYQATSEKAGLVRDGRFAMGQMVRTVRHSRLLLLPFHDKEWTNWPENIREQTEPASPPIGDSAFASAVLAVTLPAYQDLDGDGFPDADDDRDGAIDEDLPNDRNFDFAPGIAFVDDDGDGSFDEGSSASWDDDEAASQANEDPIDGLDNDDDQNIDEDQASDMNGDGCPGLCGVDDDGDGQVDEGSADDDDEDGGEYDDWYNAVVFYFYDGSLWQRTPVPWDENESGSVSGLDFVFSPIADNVTRFRVERRPAGFGEPQLVDLTIELTGPETGETVSLQTQVRVGGAL